MSQENQAKKNPSELDTQFKNLTEHFCSLVEHEFNCGRFPKDLEVCYKELYEAFINALKNNTFSLDPRT